jgi:hypothetical protein
MGHRKRGLLLLGAPLPLLLWASFQVDHASPAEPWWSHVAVLSSDQFEGRKSGTPGYSRAADYVARQFARVGLSPAGTNSFFEPVPLISRTIDPARSNVSVTGPTSSEQLTLGEDVIIGLQVDPPPLIEAELVFAGYGLSVPEAHHDDFADLDVRGKLVIFLGRTPGSLSGNLVAHSQSPAERAAKLRQAGAVGSLWILSSANQARDWMRLARDQFQPSMMLADPSMNDGRDLKLFLYVNPDRADRLLAGSGHTLQEILAADAAGKALPRFPIPKKLRAEVNMTRTSVVSPNVLAILPGTDDRLKNEQIVFSAHLDHLGIGPPLGQDSIYNGALDNAAGVASLIHVASLLTESGVRLRRSVLFAAFTSEEEGLLGSRYFVDSATGDSRKIVADINSDMLLPLFPLKKLIVYGREESELGEDAAAVAQSKGIIPLADVEPERNSFVRSDQYSFIRRGIPSLTFRVGFDRDTPEHQTVKKWRAERYHTPSDDVNQPVDKEAGEAFDAYIAKLLERIANKELPPRWRDASFFKRFAESKRR